MTYSEHEIRAVAIHRAVWERFEGIAPKQGDEIDLSAVILAVLDELERRGFIEVELRGESKGDRDGASRICER